MRIDPRKCLELFAFVAAATILAVCLHGCARADRARCAADVKAGVAAAREALKSPETVPIVDMILAGIDVRIPATAGVNSSEIPAPTMTPQEIEANPQHYIDTAPPEPPTPWGKIATIIGIGFTIAYPFLKRAPYAGEAISFIHDVLYPLLVSPKAAELDREAHQLLLEKTRTTDQQG